MQALSYDGILFSTLHVGAGLSPSDSGAARRAVALTRMDGTPLHAGMSQQPRTFQVEFNAKATYAQEATLVNLLAALDIDNPDERTFQASINGETVQCQAATGTFRWTSTKTLIVEFIASDPKWRSVSTKSTSAGAIAAAPSGVTVLPLVNKGGVRVSPQLSVVPIVQRASTDANTGWGYYRTVGPITNDSGEDWVDEWIELDLGDTSAWVTATKAQADGDDVRVRCQGLEFYRTLTNFNTKRTFCHVLLSLKKTKSITLEVWYGNPSAAAPSVTLSTRTGTKKSYVAPDLEGDSGTASSGTVDRITDTTKTWETSRWMGGYVICVGGTNSGRKRRIKDSGSNWIDVNRSFVSACDNTTQYVIWKSGLFADGGRVTGGVGAKSFTDTGHVRKWGAGQLVGATLTWIGGSAASPSSDTITANSSDGITLTTNYATPPAVGDQYTIEMYGAASYNVDTTITGAAHRGVYRINTYYQPPGTTWPGNLTPMGFGPDTYLNNGDDKCSYTPYSSGSGGGHGQNWQPLPRSRRRRAQEAELPNEGSGDGWSLRSPQGFKGAYFDYQFQNESGIGKFVFAVRAPGNGNWRDVVTNTDTHASLTAITAQYVDLSDYSNPTRLGFFVLPADGEVVDPDAAITDDIEFRSYKSLELFIDQSNHSGLVSNLYSVSSETVIYDEQVALRLGGGTSAELGYDEVQAGGSGHWLALPLNYELRLTFDPGASAPIAAIYNGAGTFVKRAQWAVVVNRNELNIDGNNVSRVSPELVPLRPAINLLTNPDFAGNITSWTKGTDTGGLTTTHSYESVIQKLVTGDPVTGSYKINISACPGGAWDTYASQDVTSLPVDKVWEGAIWAYVTSLSLHPYIRIITNFDTLLHYEEYEYTPSFTGDWFPIGAGALPDQDSTEATGTVTFQFGVRSTGVHTGSVYFDEATLGPPNLYISEDVIGTQTVTASWAEGWHS